MLLIVLYALYGKLILLAYFCSHMRIFTFDRQLLGVVSMLGLLLRGTLQR